MLFIVFLFSIILAMALYFNLNRLDINSAKQLMKANYEEIDTSVIEGLDGFLEVLDNNRKVIYRKGVNPNNTETYTPYEYFELISQSEFQHDAVGLSLKIDDASISINNHEKNGKYVYTVDYNREKEFLLVVAVPEKQLIEYVLKGNRLEPKKFMVLMILIDLVILTLVFIILSRATSTNFIKPLKLLTEGARQISKGNYNARIDLKSSNEFGELRDTFNHMAEKIEIERSLKEKSEENRKSLILDISHDLKNPLASILGYSEFILKNQDLEEEEVRKYIQTIVHNSERANNLIGDLFEFSKLESTEFKLKLKSMDICEFLRELIASYIPQFEVKGIDYEFDIPEEQINIIFDEKNLDRALGNIIINAIKYNPPNTKLHITTTLEKQFFVISIEDDGVGIPEDIQSEIFNAFVRVDSSRNSQKGGTGLGLAISKKIIEMLGGSVSLESKLEVGSVFIVRLPLQ
jgi:signal transduction histidine kinase